MYTAPGIRNNVIYVELRVRERDKVKIFLDDKAVTQGKNEKGGTVISDGEQRWSAGRYAFQAFDGEHSLELVFYDGETGEAASVPTQTVTLRRSFCCVILDQADGGIWCPAPNEYFGKQTHARLASDGSYADPGDTEPEEVAADGEEQTPGAEEDKKDKNKKKEEKQKRKEEKEEEREKKKEEKEKRLDLYSRKTMTVVGIILISMVLLCVALFFVLGALSPSPYGQPPETGRTVIAVGDLDRANEFLQGTWTYFLTADEKSKAGEDRLELEAYTFRYGSVTVVSASFDVGGGGATYLIDGKSFALTGSETRNGTYQLTRSLGDGAYEIRIDLNESEHISVTETIYMTVTLDFDQTDRLDVSSLRARSGEPAGYTGDYTRWNYEDNKEN